jgi:hypothetical protein
MPPTGCLWTDSRTALPVVDFLIRRSNTDRFIRLELTLQEVKFLYYQKVVLLGFRDYKLSDALLLFKGYSIPRDENPNNDVIKLDDDTVSIPRAGIREYAEIVYNVLKKGGTIPNGKLLSWCNQYFKEHAVK